MLDRLRKATRGSLHSVDELFRPNAHATQQQWEAQTEAPAPSPDPGDPPLDEGRIVLRLTD
ncbi:MAG TPA: hypothetical protein VN200_03450 [Rhodoglobus sp.]|nr:hypothetical protein [Rhodoglobus sp.]